MKKTVFMPDSTVIITHWNTPPHLMKRCMESVIATGLPYIIVDDCSDEAFRANLLPYNNVIFLDKNVGTYKAFEVALHQVKTPYVTRMDSDDYFLCTPTIFDDYDAYVNTFGGKVKLDLMEFAEQPYAGTNGMTAKTDVIKKVWLYDDTRTYGDIIIFARLLRKYRVVAYVQDSYMYAKRQGNSITASVNRREKVEISKARIRRENDGEIC